MDVSMPFPLGNLDIASERLTRYFHTGRLDLQLLNAGLAVGSGRPVDYLADIYILAPHPELPTCQW